MHWNESTLTGQQVFGKRISKVLLNRCTDYIIRGISKSCFIVKKYQIKTIFQTNGEGFV